MRFKQGLSITSNILITNGVASAIAAIITAWLTISLRIDSVLLSATVFLSANTLVALPANLAVTRRYSQPLTKLACAMDANHPAYADLDYVEELGRQVAMEPQVSRLVNSCSALLKTVREDRMMMERISLTDPLTEVGNSRALHQGLEIEIARAAKHKDPSCAFSVLILDLDRFKEINDSLGHLTGDAVLREMAELLCQNVRKSDRALASPEHFRFGGDEFVIIAPQTSVLKAGMLAERLDLIIMNYPFETNDGRLLSDTSIGPIRASIGTATYPDEAATPDELLELADKRMYAVKEERRLKQFYRVPAGVAVRADVRQ